MIFAKLKTWISLPRNTKFIKLVTKSLLKDSPQQAVRKAQAVYGSEAANDPYRGLRIDRDEVKRLLDRQPGIPLFAVDTESDRINNKPLNWLKQTFGLSEFDLDLILIALAPEIDLGYERLYAYLQDDVTRRRSSVDLALNLLCPSAEAFS